MILSRIAANDGAQLIDALLLQKTGKAGTFDLYEPEGGGARFGFAGEWFALADATHEPFMVRVLESIGGDNRLQDDPQFRQWMSRLPADRMASAYVRLDDAVHALALTGSPNAFSVHYAGQSPRFAPLLARVGSAKSLGRGPAPEDAMLVAALNLHDPSPRQVRFIDRLIAPRTFEHDVLPALAAPFVVWFAPGSATDMPPTLGAATLLADRNVSEVFDLAMSNALLLANVAAMRWDIPPVSAVEKDGAGEPYHVVPLHEALQNRARLPLLQHADLAFGLCGDWYVLTSQERAFLDARRAVASAPQPVEEGNRRPIARVMLQGKPLAEHLGSLNEAMPLRAARSNAGERLRALAPWLQRYHTIDVSLDVDGDEVVYATLNATR